MYEEEVIILFEFLLLYADIYDFIINFIGALNGDDEIVQRTTKNNILLRSAFIVV